jgi:hypothetical protein
MSTIAVFLAAEAAQDVFEPLRFLGGVVFEEAGDVVFEVGAGGAPLRREL